MIKIRISQNWREKLKINQNRSFHMTLLEVKNIFFSLTCEVEDKNALKLIRIRWKMTNNLWSQILVMLCFEYLLAILIFHMLNVNWTRIGHFAPLCPYCDNRFEKSYWKCSCSLQCPYCDNTFEKSYWKCSYSLQLFNCLAFFIIWLVKFWLFWHTACLLLALKQGNQLKN